MTARIEAWLYGTQEASMAAVSGIQVTEPGPTVYTARLLTPTRLSDALTAWAAALNGSLLAGTYALTWDTSAQAVTISATGVASFEVEFLGNVHNALGFSSATGHTGALTYTGDQQALARFDALRWSTEGVVPHDDVEVHQYRHGRHRAIAWSQVDVIRGRLYATRARMDALARSYCAAGLVRVYPDESVSSAYSESQTDGYVDGMVLDLSGITHSPARGLSSCDIAIGRGRNG